MDFNNKMIAAYRAAQNDYIAMKRYYDGDHDIKRLAAVAPGNHAAVENFVAKFIDEEVNYSFGNPLSFTSKSGDSAIISAIDAGFAHWRTNHNTLLARNLEIFGKVYSLSYIDVQGRYCERIITPLNGIDYTVDGVTKRFIHFYQRPYDKSQYHDVYYDDGTIEIYRDGTLAEVSSQPFKGVPVTICEMDDISETIFYKIKSLQDSYNRILSDQANTISEYRNAMLLVSGIDLDADVLAEMRKSRVLDMPDGGKAEWLIKEMNADYIENMLTDLRNAMYSVCNHIDGNEKMQSNLSGVALRSRLIFLEQRSKAIYDYIADAIFDRLERYFEYLALKEQYYNVADINIAYVPNVPQDISTIVQNIVQLGDTISHETALSLLPFVENPALELEKIRREREAEELIDLEKIEG